MLLRQTLIGVFNVYRYRHGLTTFEGSGCQPNLRRFRLEWLSQNPPGKLCRGSVDVTGISLRMKLSHPVHESEQVPDTAGRGSEDHPGPKLISPGCVPGPKRPPSILSDLQRDFIP